MKVLRRMFVHTIVTDHVHTYGIVLRVHMYLFHCVGSNMITIAFDNTVFAIDNVTI